MFFCNKIISVEKSGGSEKFRAKYIKKTNAEKVEILELRLMYKAEKLKMLLNYTPL
jgi:hypothetical protein